MTFRAFAASWIDEATTPRGLKRSTSRSYRTIIDRHLEPAFGSYELHEITVEQVERFIVGKRRTGLSAATVNRTLNVLSLVLKATLRRGLVRDNVVSQVDRPRERRRRWCIFTPAEVAAVERVFDELIDEAEADRDRDDRIVTRRLFLAHMATGIRRGEAAGLRWRSLALADPDGPTLRVEETFVRRAADTPKLTNAAAAGTSPEALMSRAGHSSYATTRRYFDLAGERFRDEAERLEQRLWGASVPKRGTKMPLRRPPTQPTKCYQRLS